MSHGLHFLGNLFWSYQRLLISCLLCVCGWEKGRFRDSSLFWIGSQPRSKVRFPSKNDDFLWIDPPPSASKPANLTCLTLVFFSYRTNPPRLKGIEKRKKSDRFIGSSTKEPKSLFLSFFLIPLTLCLSCTHTLTHSCTELSEQKQSDTAHSLIRTCGWWRMIIMNSFFPRDLRHGYEAPKHSLEMTKTALFVGPKQS